MTPTLTPESKPTTPAALRFTDVRLRYPGAAQDTVSLAALELGSGERLLVRGPSGCGKSTLLSLAAGVLLPTSGVVELLGLSWGASGSGARDARRADHVGYVFQQFNLLPYLSVMDNVLLPCRFSRRRDRRAAEASGSARAAAADLLADLGLAQHLWDRPAMALSVGQQQRVAAARALIGSPEVVIADEPTSALDEERRDEFMDLLTRHCSRAGSALLFVSHDSRLGPHFERVVELPQINRGGA